MYFRDRLNIRNKRFMYTDLNILNCYHFDDFSNLNEFSGII